MIKTVFFGTAEFAEKILLSLIEDPEIQVDLVITQPDKPVGRKQILEAPPVKITAEKHGIQIFQPESLKDNFDTEILKNFDLAITCQYGLIIPKNVIEAPKYKTINIHPSLLPKYRGASPLQSALINGEIKTGVTIMLIDEKMDHGDMLAQEEINISPTDTIIDLREKILPLTISLAIKTAKEWTSEKITSKPQDHEQATFCKMFDKEDGHIDFKNQTANEIYNKYRGLIEWPGIWTILKDIRMKLLSIELSEEKLDPEQIKKINKEMVIGTKEKSLIIKMVQPEGKKPMKGIDFLNGHGKILL